MPEVETFLADEISIKDSGPTEVANFLGVLGSASGSKTEEVNQVPSIGQGAKYQQN